MIDREVLWLLCGSIVTAIFIFSVFRCSDEYCRTCGERECDYNCWGPK